MNYEIGQTYEIKRDGEVIDIGKIEEAQDNFSVVRIFGMWFDANTGNRVFSGETKGFYYLGERIEHVSEKGQSAA